MSSFKPMLAATLKGEVRYPVWVSPKLDGVRAVVKNGVVLSRSLKPIPNKYVQAQFSWCEGLDGELIVGSPTDKNCMQNTTSGIMSVEGEPNVYFHYFDCFTHPTLKFFDRFGVASDLVDVASESTMSDTTRVVPVNQTIVTCDDELYQLETDYLSLGYEGLILRAPEVPYKYGRSTLKEGSLTKLKRFNDSEAIVVATHELLHNENSKEVDALGYSKRSTRKSGLIQLGMLGSFEVKAENWDINFFVGSGFTEQQRKDFWLVKDQLIGKIIKFKYFEQGVKAVPRFPTFVGFRSNLDR
jgi:DNA ligase-1